MAPEAAPPDPAAARHAAHSILGRAEFSSVHPSLLDQARHWLGQQLGRIFSGSWDGLGLAGIVLLAVVIVAVVALTVVAARRVSGDRTRPPDAVGFAGRSPTDWAAEADACERRGDSRGALRARYRALLAELVRRGLLDEVPGNTAGEYRRALADAVPAVAGDFGEATELFENVVYGDLAAAPEDARRVGDLAGLVLARTR